MFSDPQQPTKITVRKPSSKIEFGREDIKYALGKLSKNKAEGCDGLSDNVLKSFKNEDEILAKLALTFSSWFNEGKLPPYMKKALLTPLSKQETPFPDVGYIRPIAVLPASFKLFEHLVLR